VKTAHGWLEAPPIPETLVCNIGDMLDRLTGGYYRSVMSDQHVIEGQGASPTNRTAPARLTRRHHGLLDSSGNQKGILIFDRTGHYSSQLTGASRIKFASTRLQGTPEENKGVSAGSLAHFGTYSVDAAGTTLTFHVERSSFPNWDDTDQKWSIIKLAGDDLTLGVARTSSGGKAELVWKRAE
jgi:hypothetical protein